MFLVSETRGDLEVDWLDFYRMKLITHAKSQMGCILLLNPLTKIIAGLLMSIFLQPSLVSAIAH